MTGRQGYVRSKRLSRFRTNLRYLNRTNPLLADEISQLFVDDGVTVARSRSGAPTLGIRLSSGNTEFVHSTDDPIEETIDLLKGQTFKREDGTVLFGFGLGYVAKEILKRKEPGHVCYILEGLHRVFRAAMEYVDLSDILCDPDTYLFVGEGMEWVLDEFRAMQRKVVAGRVQKLATERLYSLCRNRYDEVSGRIEKRVCSIKAGLFTFNSRREHCLKNCFRNLDLISKSLPVDVLEGTAAEQTAIVVGAGPTLSDDLHAIRKHKEDFLIISVDAALKPLLDADVVPTVLVTCDSLPVNSRKIERIPTPVLSGIPLIYQADATPELVERFEGPKYVTSPENSLTGWLTNLGRPVRCFQNVRTVSHLGFFLARFMGVRRVILSGVDLSFPNGRDHATGCEKTWGINLEKGRFEWVAGNDGSTVRTCGGFLSMIRVFEEEIDRLPRGAVINTSQKGAVIRGAERMPIEEAIAGTQVYRRNGSRQVLSEMFQQITPGECQKLKNVHGSALTWFRKELGMLRPICIQARSILKEMETGKGSDARGTGKWEILNDLVRTVLGHRQFLDIVTDYLPGFMTHCEKYPGFGKGISMNATTAEHKDGIEILLSELSQVISLVVPDGQAAEANVGTRQDGGMNVQNAV